MKDEKIYDLGKKFGLDKKEIKNILKSGIPSCAIAIIPTLCSRIYHGSYYGTISIYDF